MRVYKKNFYLKWLRTPKKTQKKQIISDQQIKRGVGEVQLTPQPQNNGKHQTLPTDISQH